MKISLIWVGKTKERSIREGIEKYVGLLHHYSADIKVTELREEKGCDAGKTVQREGERILKLDVPYVLLDERGECMTSVEFADFLQKQRHPIVFVIGGAFGVSDAVREKAIRRIALSKMTFTHEMARLIFLEQLYRAFTIIHHRGYHH